MAISTTSVTEVVNNGGGTWADYGSGGGSSSNTDVFLTSTGSRARKVSNGVKGFAYDLGVSGTDISGDIVSVRWQVTAGVSTLDAYRLAGVRITIEDTNGDRSLWMVDGNDTYSGGWRVSVMDLRKPQTSDVVALSPVDLTIARYIGIEWDQTASVGGGDPNCYIDQILRIPQAGVTITGNTTSLFDDLVDVIDNPTNGPYGLFERRGGIIFSKVPIVLSPDASDISESDRTLVFEQIAYASTTSGTSAVSNTTMDTCGISSTDADDITLTRCNIIYSEPDQALLNSGGPTGDFTDKEFDFSGMTGVLTLDGCTISGFGSIPGTTGASGGQPDVVDLGDTGMSITDCNFVNNAEIIDTGAVIRGCKFINGREAGGMYEWDEETDMEDCEFSGDGTGHSIHFTHNSGTNLTGGSAIVLTDINFSGGGLDDTATSDIDMNPDTASIDVDFNISGGNTPTLDQRSPYTGTATATQTVTVAVTAQEADGSKIQDARVRLEADAGGDLPSDASVTIATSGTTATVTHTAHGLATNDYVIIRGANESELTGRNQITVTGVNTYTYTITSIAGAPGTGTITSTYSILSAFTNASGLVQDTGFVFTNNQPVRGAVRKGTISPFYKQSPLTGTITTNGLSLVITMTPD